jgi:hypothetical protein
VITNWKSFEIFSIESKSICKVKAGTPDGVEAPVGEGDHWVDVDDEVEVEVKARVDEDDGYDMPMSIYSQSFITFVSKLLRSSLG